MLDHENYVNAHNSRFDLMRRCWLQPNNLEDRQSDWIEIPPSMPIWIHHNCLKGLLALGCPYPFDYMIASIDANLEETDRSDVVKKEWIEDLKYTRETIGAEFEVTESTEWGDFTYILAIHADRIVAYLDLKHI